MAVQIVRKMLGSIFIVVATLTIIWTPRVNNLNDLKHSPPSVFKQPSKNWRGLNATDINRLSKLGRILFMEEEPPSRERTQTYEILVWKYGKTIENRHLKNFGSETMDPFENCSVTNCRLTYKDSALASADIVIFHLHQMEPDDLPTNRSATQIWAFLTDESPYNTFMKSNRLENYNGVFNWSMTYRMDSDIPVPYGRTIRRRNTEPVHWNFTKRDDVLVAILGSNCGGRNNRWKYVNELKKHIDVDVYGGCGTLQTCPGHFRSDCRDIDDYRFYLSFENSNCDEYVTEKVWWNAYEKNSIPILMGAGKSSYDRLLPPGSYLNVEDFTGPQQLAEHILYLNKTGKYNDYYKWKSEFRVLNEHGYFQSKSYHYCRVCEALNYNDRTSKVYEDLEMFWSIEKNCHKAWDA